MSVSVQQQQQVFWIGDTLWNLYGNVRQRLFDNQGLRLEHWKEQGLATLIKQGPGRTIYRVRLPGLDLYVKHFRATTFVNFLHQLIRQGRAEKEFQLAHLLEECGVATVKPVALGERRRNGMLLESFLLTETIPNGLTLYELIEHCVMNQRMPFPPSRRFHLTRELARLAALIHQAGIEHRDLHERNIVAQANLEGNYRLFLLDLHELRLHKPLEWASACKELARMGRYFTLRTTVTDRYRFFVHYARSRGFSTERIRALASKTEHATLLSRADFWRRRDTRSPYKNSRLQEYRIGGMQIFAASEIPEETVRRLAADPDAPFHDHVVYWWKIGRSTRVAEVDLPTIRRGETLIYKQYNFKGWHESLAALFRSNQATRAWNWGAALLLRELPTPRPLVLIHKLRLGLPVTSYLITERVPDSLTINRYLQRHLANMDAKEGKRLIRGVLTESAYLLRKLHDRGVSHRDLKASNILASYSDDIAHPHLWVIDLDGVQTWHTVPERHRIQNLTRFHVSFHNNPWVSRADKLRFLRIYLGRAFADKNRWKLFWHSIREHTEKKIARNLRKGRSIV